MKFMFVIYMAIIMLRGESAQKTASSPNQVITLKCDQQPSVIGKINVKYEIHKSVKENCSGSKILELCPDKNDFILGSLHSQHNVIYICNGQEVKRQISPCRLVDTSSSEDTKQCFPVGSVQLKCQMSCISDECINVLTKDINTTSNLCNMFDKSMEKYNDTECKEGNGKMCRIPGASNYECSIYLHGEFQLITIEFNCQEKTSQSLPTVPTTKLTTERRTYSSSSVTIQPTTSFIRTSNWPYSSNVKSSISTTTMEQHISTTADNNDDIDASSQKSSGSIGMIVGVVFGLLFVCVMGIGIFCFLRRFKNTDRKKCFKDDKNANIHNDTVDISRESQQYVELSKTNQNDHIYKVISNSMKPRNSTIDGAEYTSIDDTQNVGQQNTNVGTTQEYVIIADEQSDSVNGKSAQHLVDPHSNYDILGPSMTGFNQSHSPKIGCSIVDHHEYNKREDSKEVEGAKPDGPANLCPNESLSMTNTEMERSQPIDNYILLDPSETGFDRSNIMESKSEPLIDEYSVLDSSVTGFNRSNHDGLGKGKNLAGDDFALLDPKETGYDRLKLVNETKSDDYTVLDPNETGFDRSSEKRNHKYQDGTYKLTEPLSSQTDDDHYTCSKEGNYDELGLDRHKVDKDNVYSHTVETVYDTTSHVRNQERIDDTYDHFVGQTN